MPSDPRNYHDADGNIDWGLFVAVKATAYVATTTAITVLGPFGALAALAAVPVLCSLADDDDS